MYAVSYQYSESVFSIVTNIMISLAFIQFCAIVLYHFLTYTCLYNVELALSHSKQKLIQLWANTQLSNHSSNDPLLNMPEDMFYLDDYQDETDNNGFNGNQDD